MLVQADDYRRSAGERLAAAGQLLEAGRYAEAIYLAGVAAECTFRAFAGARGRPFDGRHDLHAWFRLAVDGLAGDCPVYQQRLSVAVSELWTRWKNNFRYLPEDRILAVLRNAGLTREIKGSQLKESTRRAYNAAVLIVTRGESRWTHWRR